MEHLGRLPGDDHLNGAGIISCTVHAIIAMSAQSEFSLAFHTVLAASFRSQPTEPTG